MGDQFWPALYPGLIVGILYGLSLRGWANVALGAVGGFAGSVAAYFALQASGLTDGVIPVFTMIALAALGAFGATRIGNRMRRA